MDLRDFQRGDRLVQTFVLRGRRLTRAPGRSVINRGRAFAEQETHHADRPSAGTESARAHAPDRRGLGRTRREPGTHQARRRSLDRWRVLYHAEDEIRWRNGAETLDLRPSDRSARLRRWIHRMGGVSEQRLLDHERIPPSEYCPGDFWQAGRDRRLGTSRFTIRGHAW